MSSVLPATVGLPSSLWPRQVDQNTLTSRSVAFDRTTGRLAAGNGSVRVNPNASAQPTLGASVAPGLLTDYYNRVLILPSTLDLLNPERNVPFLYQVWNAFFGPNTLQRVTATGATGLTNTLVASDAFAPLELRTFSLTFEDTAPLQVNARYDYDFVAGRASLSVLSTLATVLTVLPQAPLVQRLAWRTNVLRSHNGTEQRISVRARPRQTWALDLLVTGEREVRQLLSQLFTDLDSLVVLPLWHEPFTLTAEASAGTTLLQVDLAQADLQVGDTIYLVSPDGSLASSLRVAAQTLSSITTVSPLALTFAAGSILYPTTSVYLADGPSMSRPPVNAGRVRLTATSTDLRALGGAGGAAPATFNGRPLLDIVPLNNDPVDDAFRLNTDVIDFGTTRALFSSQLTPEVGGTRTFSLRSRVDWQTFKRFLDEIQGARGAFYAPTHRPDLELVEQPTQGGVTLRVRGESAYTTAWFAATSYRSLMLRDAGSGSQPKLVTNSVANADGTHTLTLASALTNTPEGSTLLQIELLPVCRLASDVVEVRHFGYRSELALSIQSEIAP